MEPGTPQPKLVLNGAEVTLAWTKRSEAILSRHGHDVLSVIEMMRKRRTALYGLCLGLFAALPVSRGPDAPEDIADWLNDTETQNAASSALISVIRHAYPPEAEKKSELKP